MMMISVKAVRDSDKALLGEAIFEVTNRQMAKQAMADLLEHVYASVDDPLNLPEFTFKFDKA
jgi:hypothetical protein